MDSELITNTDAPTTDDLSVVHDTDGERVEHRVSDTDPSVAPVLGFYKLFWIFLITSLGGLILEQIFCYLYLGQTGSRCGLVFGPFSPIYGFGTVLLTLILYRFHNSNIVTIFISSALVGSVFEYFSSFLLQACFGVDSWSYSHLPYNINGRVYPESILMWGILGLLWFKLLLPPLSASLDRIHIHLKKGLTTVLAILMVLDIAITCAALYRQAQRREGDAANTPIEHVLDTYFSDERLHGIFSNMKPV